MIFNTLIDNSSEYYFSKPIIASTIVLDNSNINLNYNTETNVQSIYTNENSEYYSFYNNIDISNNDIILKIKINNLLKYKTVNIDIFDVLDDILDNTSLNINNYLFNFIIDINFNNFIYDRNYRFYKINRIFNNKMFILNVLYDNINNLYIDKIKFIPRFKITKNNQVKYLIPIFKNTNNQNYFNNYLNEIFINNNNFELDSSVNLFNGKLGQIILQEVNSSDTSSLFYNGINYIYFDIFNYNYIIPKKYLINQIEFNNFIDYPLFDLYQKFFISTDFNNFRSLILSKINHPDKLNYLNFNFNNLILSYINSVYTDWTIDEIEIFIFFKDVSVINKDLVLSIGTRRNISIILNHDKNFNNNTYNIISYNEIKFNNLLNNDLYIVKNTDKITLMIGDSDVNELSKSTFDFINLSRIMINNCIKEFIDFFENMINLEEFNRIKYLKSLFISSPFGVSDGNFNIIFLNKIFLKFFNIIEPICLYNISIPCYNNLAKIMYNFSDSSVSSYNYNLVPSLTTKNKKILNLNITSLSEYFIRKINDFIDRSYILSVYINRLYNNDIYVDYINNQMIINIKIYVKNEINYDIINTIINKFKSFKLKLNIRINNSNNFEIILDPDIIEFLEKNIIHIKFYFSPLLLNIKNSYAINNLEIKNMDILI